MSGGYDEGAVYYSDQRASNVDLPVDSRVHDRNLFREFIREFSINNEHIYNDTLRGNYVTDRHYLEVNVVHVNTFNGSLAEKLVTRPGEYLSLFEDAAKDVISLVFPNVEQKDVPDIHIRLTDESVPLAMRTVGSAHIGRVIKIPGIAVACSKVKAKATRVTIACKQCRAMKVIPVIAGLTGITLPRTCDAQTVQNAGAAAADRVQCPLDPYVIIGDKSEFVDQQTVKVQERPEAVPTGEMPRAVLAVLDRSLVGSIIPGTRVNLLGVWSIFQQQAARAGGVGRNALIRTPYLRIVGVKVDHDGIGATVDLSDKRKEELRALAKDPNWYENFTQSIAPAIYGHEDIKRAIALLLVGGGMKRLPDGMRLRGDINVLLLGDPGTAKSQMLKFTEKVAPISVYTSGKGSSAAGLTASVVRDKSSSEFYLEGGAMVLADRGVVCIDEFDKMREEDRVAIHEAMEQQTISIAKAGITTILNSRTAVLAAANPIFGRFDDMLSPIENISFQSTILSRFDLIFLVRDNSNAARDLELSQHVVNLHMAQASADVSKAVGVVSVDQMREFIAFAKSLPAPRLDEKAASRLKSHYVRIRNEARESARKSKDDGPSPIPITVRQLEAIIRISESHARLAIRSEATEDDVAEAIRLFNVATVEASKVVPNVIEGHIPDEQKKNIELAINTITRKVPIKATVSVDRLLREVQTTTRIEQHWVTLALQQLIAKGDFEFRHARKNVSRIK